MYCTKCGNLLKPEDNFCNICGTPNNGKQKQAAGVPSNYGRDDESVKLDDFFKSDEKAEKTLEKMDRELETIKARATESLLRNKNGDASSRRAARMARRATEPQNGKSELGKYRESFQDTAVNFEFNDDIFQQASDKNKKLLVGRRGKIDESVWRRSSGETRENIDSPFEVKKPHDEKRAEKPANPKAPHVSAPPEIEESEEKAPKQKRRHLFRPDTVEMPNVFAEIAQSMEKSKQQEGAYNAFAAGSESSSPSGAFFTSPDENFTEGVFPLPPKDAFPEDAFAQPPEDNLPKGSMNEGVFPTQPKESAGKSAFPEKPESHTSEGVFFTSPNANFTEGVFPTTQGTDLTGGAVPLSSEESAEPKPPGEPTDKEKKEQLAALIENTVQSESGVEYFRYSRARKKKKPGIGFAVVAVLVIIVAALAVKMIYEGETPASVWNQIKGVFNISSEAAPVQQDLNTEGEGDASLADQDPDAPPDIRELRTQGAADPAKMLQYVLSQGVNKNIAEITYDPDLKFEEGKAYTIEDIDNSTAVADNVFYEENGQKYYYTEAILTSMIRYNSQWIDYFNTGDKAVLDLIQKGSSIYERTVNFSSEGAKETFVKFEAGEIRKGKEGYYIWVRETLSVTNGIKTDTREDSLIYYLEPSGKSMKIVNNYHL